MLRVALALSAVVLAGCANPPQPDTTITDGPQGTQATDSVTFAFEATLEGSTFTCRLDDAAAASCETGVAYTGLAEGDHLFTVIATSPAGQVDPTPATRAFSVNARPPETSIASGPADQARTRLATLTWDFGSDDAEATFECSLDSAPFAACSSGAAIGPFTEGPHTLEVRARDAFDRLDATPAVTRWTADFSAPDTAFTIVPASLTRQTTATLEFSSEPGATFACELDGVPRAPCTSPVSLSALAEGAHTFSVAALDDVGNRDSTPALHAWTVDTVPPETAITAGPSGHLIDTTATFSFQSTDGAATFECRLDSAVFAACTSPQQVAVTDGVRTFEVRAIDAAGNPDASPASRRFLVSGTTSTRIRVMAANTTSGNQQAYEEREGAFDGPGLRFFKGLQPDVVLIQEFEFRDSQTNVATLDVFRDALFPGFAYFRETQTSAGIPNGVISRWPILAAGEWDDPSVSDRDFVWAQIDIPGTVDLWAISLHLYSASSTGRATSVNALVDLINANVPAGDLLVIGGDLNTDSRGELAIVGDATRSGLSAVAVTAAPYPVDQNGDGDTNNASAGRAKPYDWVLADPELDPLEVPVLIGENEFPNGLVFDSRIYAPLSEVSPVRFTDSCAYYTPSVTTACAAWGTPTQTQMQHMPVVRDFLVPR